MPRKKPPTEPSTDALHAARAMDRRIGFWSFLEHKQMDAAFVEAMQAAGFALTAPSTVAGTRVPIVGYKRND